MILKFLYKLQHYDTRTISVGNKNYNAIIADTFIKRTIGLMFRESIKENECMLFIFDSPWWNNIWMPNMLFSIDAIWLNEKSQIIYMQENLQPCKSRFGCKQYGPKEKSTYIMEFKSGTIKDSKINRNTKIKLKK